MKTIGIRRSCQIILILAGCVFISQQAQMYADENTNEASKISPFKISDDMRCGISEFRDSVLSIVNVEPFGENQNTLFHFNSGPVHFIAAVKYTGKTRDIPENKIKALLT